MLLFALLLASLPALADNSAAFNAMGPDRLNQYCESTASDCSTNYAADLELYRKLGCRDLDKNCDPEVSGARAGDCKAYQAVVRENGGKFPAPEEFQKAQCNIAAQCAAASTEHIKDITERKKAGRCGRVGENGWIDDGPPMSEQMPFGVNLKGAASGFRGQDKADTKPLPTYLIERDSELETHPDCLKKQNASSFCPRLYREPPSDERGNSPPPAELLGHLRDAHAAGMIHKRDVIRLSFKSRKDCSTALVKLDQEQGEIIAFFRPFALDVEKICDGLASHAIGDYWRFLSGTIPTNHKQPVLYLGKFE